MQKKSFNLRIPGPTTLYPEVRKIMGSQAFNHRGQEFGALITETSTKLQKIFHTKNDVLIITGSGTSAMEAAVINTLSEGDKIVVISIGTFGDRFSQIAHIFGANVIDLKFPYGVPADPIEVKQALKKNKGVKAVLVTHNETSTGVLNDLEQISKIVKQNSDALLIVDGVSSVAAIALPTDKWNCDVVISASQKGFGTPPGIAMVSMSDLAWKYYEKSKLPKYYLDLGRARKSLFNKQTPWTPATHQIAGLNKGLDLLLSETLPAVIKRHQRAAEKVRTAVNKLGLELLAPESHASPVLTAVKTKHADEIVKEMRKKGVEIAGGYGPLKGKIFRIGHLGFFTDEEIDETIKELKGVISKI
jgi:aspartate aminotransferase-like enzyme